MFGCHLPPALLAEWPESFTRRCGNTGVERTANKSQHTKWTLEKKLWSVAEVLWSVVFWGLPWTLGPPAWYELLLRMSVGFVKYREDHCKSSTVQNGSTGVVTVPCYSCFHFLAMTVLLPHSRPTPGQSKLSYTILKPDLHCKKMMALLRCIKTGQH